MGKIELKSYVCKHIFENSRPVLLVSKMDGDLCFLCGSLHDDTAEEYRVVGANHILDRDQSLIEIAMKLNDNFEAERKTVDSPWIITSEEEMN